MGGSLKKRLLIGGLLAIVALLIGGAAFAVSTWGAVKRVSIDRPTDDFTRGYAHDDEASAVANASEDGDVTVPPSGDGLDVLLMVGSDSRDQLATTEGFGNFAGNRADVVMVLIRPRDKSSKAAVLSLPRDLWVDNICSTGKHRLNDALEGCGTEMNGPTALTLTVESLIGVTVDHFALVDLAGFQEAVDAVGGYEICLDHAVRDSKADLSLPAGCTHASGAQTLAWLRSRNTQELTASGWRTMAGVNDLTRNERQRQFLISMLGRLGDFSSPQDVTAMARALAPYVTVDDGLSLVDAVGLAWTMRDLGSGSTEQLEVSYTDATAGNGAAVLLPAQDIAQVVAAYLAPETAEEPSDGVAG